MKIIKESKQEKLPIDFITQFVSKGWEEVGNLKASIEGIEKTFSGTAGAVNILQNLIDSYLIAIGQMELYLNNKKYLDLPDENKLTEGLDAKNKVFCKDDKTGLECGINADGKLYFGDDKSGANLDDTPENREKLANTWKIYTGKTIDIAKLTESNDMDSNKADCENKTKFVTTLPEFDVEVEQEDGKLEIEVEPKKNEIVNDFKIDSIKDEFKPPIYDDEVEDTVEIKDVFKRGDFKTYGKDVDLKAHNAEPFEYFTDFEEPDVTNEEESDYKAWMHHIGK